MGLFKKAKKIGKKIRKKATKWAKNSVDFKGNLKRVRNFSKSALKSVVGGVGDILSPLTGMFAPDIDLGGESVADMTPDPNKSMSDAVEAEQERAQKYAAFSTEATTNKKRKLGNYGEGSEIQKYIDRLQA